MITARQKRLLEAIIKEFIETAEAVGSIDLPEKYGLDVSPATIRNEMATLVSLGYLNKTHASSGRIPTTRAFKYFLQEILDQLQELDVREQAHFNEDMFQKRYNIDQLMISAVRALSSITHNPSIALVNDRIYHIGLDMLLNNPEYRDYTKLQHILAMLDDYANLVHIFKSHKSEQDIKVLIGEDLRHPALYDSAIVFANIPSFHKSSGYIAILGPNRMQYEKVIPAIRYVSNKISNLLKDWKI